MIGTYTKQARRAFGRLGSAGREVLVTHSPPWLRRALGPAAKHADMLLVDHGLFRVAYLNRHRIDEHAWRSAQPTPGQIGRIAASGVKTILNLRGERHCGSYWLEQQACARHNVALVNFVVRSRAAPRREDLHAARDLFQRLEYPILMHCKSGADRAGLMSVLYLFLHRGVPLSIAKRQLALRYGHIRQADTGVLDYFFDRYEADNARSPIDFFEWVDTVYDPVELKATFRASSLANRLVNNVLHRE